MHHPTYRIAHNTDFVKPVVEHWLEWEIAHWVHHIHLAPCMLQVCMTYHIMRMALHPPVVEHWLEYDTAQWSATLYIFQIKKTKTTKGVLQLQYQLTSHAASLLLASSTRSCASVQPESTNEVTTRQVNRIITLLICWHYAWWNLRNICWHYAWWNPRKELLFAKCISSKGSFICTFPQTGSTHQDLCYTTCETLARMRNSRSTTRDQSDYPSHHELQ